MLAQMMSNASMDYVKVLSTIQGDGVPIIKVQ